jgi:hypothetical protein
MSALTSWWKRHPIFVIMWPICFSFGMYALLFLPTSDVANNHCLVIYFLPSKQVLQAAIGLTLIPQIVVPIGTFIYAFTRMVLRMQKKKSTTSSSKVI